MALSGKTGGMSDLKALKRIIFESNSF